MSAHRDKCKLWCRLEGDVGGGAIESMIGAMGTALGTTDFAVGTWGNGAQINASNEGVTFPSTTDYCQPAGTWQIECNPVGWSITNGASSSGTGHTIFGMYGTSPDTRLFDSFINTSGFWWRSYNTSYTGFGGAPTTPALMDAAAGSKNHLTLVWNEAGIEGGANTMEVYWNGVLVVSTTNALTVPTASRSAWFVGNHQTLPASDREWDGVIDNIKIFSAALRDVATGAAKDYEGWLYHERKGGGHVFA